MLEHAPTAEAPTHPKQSVGNLRGPIAKPTTSCQSPPEKSRARSEKARRHSVGFYFIMLVYSMLFRISWSLQLTRREQLQSLQSEARQMQW